MARPGSLSARQAVSLHRQCVAFNLLHPAGTRVRGWRGLVGRGTPVEGVILEPGAYVLGDHSAVVRISGCSGCIAVTHVEACI